MPITQFQREVLAVTGKNRTPDSYLAGGAAIHFTPTSLRFSNDLDFFNDSVERVASAFADDSASLAAAGIAAQVEISQPGFVRAIVRRGKFVTRIDWAHDSSWRFMPPVRDALGGFLLHEIDLATSKTLALAGRDEPRDYVDILFFHERVLALGGLVWAAVGKDPGFTPLSLLELLKRHGRYRPEEFERLDLVGPFDVARAKQIWLGALDEADTFVRARPPDEAGCLYFSTSRQRFVIPTPENKHGDVVVHFGQPGGVLPQPSERTLL